MQETAWLGGAVLLGNANAELEQWAMGEEGGVSF